MYDIIIIGAGTAGISAYQEAIKKTQNILIVNHGPWDTTCARVGCMPSKVLISSANRAFEIKNAADLGLNVEATIDTTPVMPHLRQLRDRFTRATLKNIDTWSEHHKINGKANFVNHNTISVNGENYQAKSFIVAVGSTPNIPTEWQEQLQERLITSDQIFELEQLPKSVAVIGSGVIALELAQALNHLGVKTTMFARSKRIGSLSSPNLQKTAQEVISKDLNILFEVLPQHFSCSENVVNIEFVENGEIKHLQVDYVLAATGRSSLLEQVKLENIDLTFKDIKKLPIDQQTKQLSNYPIFIVGDAYTTTPIQHEAAHEGRKAALNCLNYPDIEAIKTMVPLSIVFSYPEMAIVGKSYKQLQENHMDIIVGYASYEKQGRALVSGQNRGAIEIYIDKKTQRLLGAELFMATAGHLAHLLAWMMGMNATLNDLIEQPYYHPTLEEGLRTALKHARRQLNNHPSNN